MRHLLKFTLPQLKEYFLNNRIPPFRANQIVNWIYKNRVLEFKKMKNLSQELINFLEQNFFIRSLSIVKILASADGTQKYLFSTQDNFLIESVYIPHLRGRHTLCVSTQIGCKFGCRFCASTKLGFIRNLTYSEIIEQILTIQSSLENRITNIVFMGIGEPLDNLENVLKSLEFINSDWGIGISQRKITISTCGLIPQIKMLSSMKLKIELAVSLHASHQKLREYLMPISKKYPLENLINVCREYFMTTGRDITFEYIAFKDLNTSFKDALLLSRLLRGFNFKINIIPYNPIKEEKNLQPPNIQEVKRFNSFLKKLGVRSIIRKTRGRDIEGACGQLRLNIIKK